MAVTGFTVSDINVSNATVGDLTGSRSTYTATIVPTMTCPADLGANTVELTVTDINGNTATCSATVILEATGNCESAPSFSPMIPTAFTPNGDGANDLWIIDNLSEDASMRIYNRHGTIIFSSDRGSRLPAGSYLYLIQNGPHTYKGTVTILL